MQTSLFVMLLVNEARCARVICYLLSVNCSTELVHGRSEIGTSPQAHQASGGQTSDVGIRRPEGNLDCAAVSGGDLVWLNGRTPNSKL
jgi:hypothetical protein